jgi:hypothetical protein
MRFIIYIALLASLQGCILVPFINSFKQIGATKADRKVLLEKDLKEFNTAMRAQRFDAALQYVDQAYMNEFKNTLRSRMRSEKIVDMNVEMFDLAEDVRSGQIDMVMRYYEVPYYVVKDRLYEQDWAFSSGSWKLRGQREVAIQGQVQ